MEKLTEKRKEYYRTVANWVLELRAIAIKHAKDKKE